MTCARRRIPRKTVASTDQGTELERPTPEELTETPLETRPAPPVTRPAPPVARPAPPVARPDQAPPTREQQEGQERVPLEYVASVAPGQGVVGLVGRPGVLPDGRPLSADQVAYLRGLGVIQGADGGWVLSMPDGGNTIYTKW